MNDRILHFLKQKNLSALKLAEIMEVQASSISHITSGRNKPSFDFIAKFLMRFPDVNPDWLILGKGNMFRNPSAPQRIENVGNSVLHNEPELAGLSAADPGDERYGRVESPPPLVRQKEMILSESPSTDTDNEIRKRMESLPVSEPSIERIVIFYSDRTFTEYSMRK